MEILEWEEASVDAICLETEELELVGIENAYSETMETDVAGAENACSEMNSEMLFVENVYSKMDLKMASIENRCLENEWVDMQAVGGGSTVYVAGLLGVELERLIIKLRMEPPIPLELCGI